MVIAMIESRQFAPFAGVRVADFSWVVAAPLTTQHLAVLGADVIRIESRVRPDVLRAGQPFAGGGTGPDNSVYFAGYNQGKRGITLNLRHPRAVAVARALVATCDVVAENFVPGTMEKLGLGYDELRAVRPDLIMLRMALAGQTGPERSYKGFGTVIQGAAGITELTGWPDRPPAGTGVAYTDFFAAQVAAFALLSALDHRRRTGRGAYIDLSQQEASLYGLDAALLDYATNGHAQSRQGNRHPSAAPHGAYPCRGASEQRTAGSAPGAADRAQGGPTARAEDQVDSTLQVAVPEESDAWVAVAVHTDAQWRSLSAAMGDPAWARDPRFATLLGRKAHEEELDRLLGEWTCRFTAHEAAERLRTHGVPAAVVANAHDLHTDVQLLHRGHYLHLNHPVIGDFPFDALAYRFDGAVPLPPRPAPRLGEHNLAVLGDLLGMDEDDVRELEAGGALR